MHKVRVSDVMQKKYEYELVEPIGKNFDPEFKPDLTPKQMLDLGVLGGLCMSDKPKEFPRDWFEKAKLSDHGKDPKLNYFGVNASMPLSHWQKKGWIYADDPRGWFQWYARYYMGRRIVDEDYRQIKRWLVMKRHIVQINNVSLF